MTYQVSRDGQMYGPYTFEDLQRYVASGNVLPTDLTKSEEMTDWVPVAQVLGAAGAGATAYTPVTGYAPPTPYPPAASGYSAVAGAQYPDPPNLHWGLELLLGFLTCGLFVVVWNLVIAAWAKRVEPASKALMYYILATVLIVLNVGGSWGSALAILHHHQHHQNVLGGLVSLAAWVLRLVARFTLRDTLEQHYNGPEPLGLRLSGVMTFFFGGIYIQYMLNRVNEMKQAVRYQTLAR